jgi:PKD repeat protein
VILVVLRNGIPTAVQHRVTVEPKASFTWSPALVVAGQPVSFFDATVGAHRSGAWIFPQGTPNSSSARAPRVTWSAPGLYPVRLTVITPDGFRSTTVHNVLVTSPPPVPSFVWSPQTPVAGQAVVFADATGGTDRVVGWTFEGGSPPTSTAPSPQVIWNQPGTYRITLTVADAGPYPYPTVRSVAQMVTIAPSHVTCDVLPISATSESPVTVSRAQLAGLCHVSDLVGNPTISPTASGAAVVNPDGSITFTSGPGQVGQSLSLAYTANVLGGTANGTIVFVVQQATLHCTANISQNGSGRNHNGETDFTTYSINSADLVAGVRRTDPANPSTWTWTGSCPGALQNDPGTWQITSASITSQHCYNDDSSNSTFPCAPGQHAYATVMGITAHQMVVQVYTFAYRSIFDSNSAGMDLTISFTLTR